MPNGKDRRSMFAKDMQKRRLEEKKKTIETEENYITDDASSIMTTDSLADREFKDKFIHSKSDSMDIIETDGFNIDETLNQAKENGDSSSKKFANKVKNEKDWSKVGVPDDVRSTSSKWEETVKSKDSNDEISR